VGPVTFLRESAQEEEEVLVVECDAHSASLNVRDVGNSVEYLSTYEARGRFHEFVNKIDLCSASHQMELEWVDLG
jgi:carbamoylphosphate synthase large subunit